MLNGFPRTAAALFLAIMLGAGTGGCSTNPATGEQDFTAFMSPADELRVGREEDPKIRRQFGGTYDELPALSAYVTDIGKRLAATSELPDLDFRFTVLDTPDVNAFALPGGYIYVTRGLVALAENEAELAGVIAHEIGHVTARHSARRYSRTVAANLGIVLLGTLSGQRALTDIAGQGANLYLKGYSREQEFEADMLGIRYLSRAGYDTGAMAGFLQKLAETSRIMAEAKGTGRDPDSADLLATHPRTIDRVQRALTAAKVRAAAKPERGRAAYLGHIDGIMFGNNPRHGTIRERVFLHRDLDFRFEVPPGFRLVNRPAQVLAADAGGARFIFDAARKTGNLHPLDYIRDRWAKGHRLREPEAITVNGFEAATAWIPVKARRGDRRHILRMVAIRDDSGRDASGAGAPGMIYRMQFLIPAGRRKALNEDMRRTTYSFRRLTRDERRGIRAHEVDIVTVSEDSNEGALAAHIPIESAYRERLFRVLNGLQGNNDTLPPPGTRIKTVIPR